MVAAVKGIIHGNTVIIEDEDMHEYDGTEVIVTFLNVPRRKNKPSIDWDSYVMPSTRGEHVDEYMKAFIDIAPFIYFIEKDVNNPQYFKKSNS